MAHGYDDEPAPQSDQEPAGNPYHLSPATQAFLRAVAVILIVTMTALFLRGYIRT